MKLDNQKRLAGNILKCSPKRVKFDNSRLEDIKESITKADIKSLINDKAITKVKKKGVSRGKARIAHLQRRKGKRRGFGSRKGSFNARINKKRDWMNRIRLQRVFIKSLREGNLISDEVFQSLYKKSKGGFFRSKRHIKLYIDEHHLIEKKK